MTGAEREQRIATWRERAELLQETAAMYRLEQDASYAVELEAAAQEALATAELYEWGSIR